MNIGYERAAEVMQLLVEEQSSIGQARAAHWQAPWPEPPKIRPFVTTILASTIVALLLRKWETSTSPSFSDLVPRGQPL
jgi:hypothetical protein